MTYNYLTKEFIRIEPENTVTFLDVPKRSSTCTLKITNIVSEHVIFKIKTTAPKNYVVRPNLVVLSPGETYEVQLYMNPAEGLPSQLNSRDRFMVLATDVQVDPRNMDAANKWVEKAPELVQQIKMKVDFRAPSIVNKSPGSRAESVLFDDNRNSVADFQGTLQNLNVVEGKKLISFEKSYTSDKSESMSGPSFEGNNYLTQIKNPYLQTPHYQEQGESRFYASPGTVVKSGKVEEEKDFKKMYERLLTKVEEQEKQLLKVSEERNYVYNELVTLKDNLFKKRAPTKSAPGDNHAEFQLIHVIIVAVVSLLLGAFFSV